jgi:hypothetical protein
LLGLWLGFSLGYMANAAYQRFSPLDDNDKPETPKSKGTAPDEREG